MCAAAAGQYRARGFRSQLLSRHKVVVASQFESDGQVRCRFWHYNKEKWSGKGKMDREREGEEGVMGWWGTIRHMSRIC